MDYKDWIQNRADELALEQYNEDFYNLPSEVRDTIYQQAMADYADHYASQVDAAYDRMKKTQMMEVTDE